VDKSEEKTSTEVTDGRRCNPTGSIINETEKIVGTKVTGTRKGNQ